jgi:hypothetical protein
LISLEVAVRLTPSTAYRSPISDLPPRLRAAIFYAILNQIQGWDPNGLFANIAFDRLDHFIRYSLAQ